MTKAPSLTEISKKQRDNTKTPPKTSITEWLRTDLGRSVRVTIAAQLVWWNRFFYPSLPTKHSICVIKMKHIQKFVNNPPYIDRGPTAKQRERP